uniref:Uncharacterized protein n=1 Tax=Arundo donax TaxID=35708 RepID=A0A0A9A6R0_ARUDO
MRNLKDCIKECTAIYSSGGHSLLC